MDRQWRNKGFTLIEMLLVLSVVSILVLFSIPFAKRIMTKNIELIIDDIAYCQFEAIVRGVDTYYDEYGTDIKFNRKGNINQANTYTIEGIDIVVTLGTGRIYIDEKGECFD